MAQPIARAQGKGKGFSYTGPFCQPRGMTRRPPFRTPSCPDARPITREEFVTMLEAFRADVAGRELLESLTRVSRALDVLASVRTASL